MLAVVALALALTLLRAQRVLGRLVPAEADHRNRSDQRMLEALANARTVALDVHGGTERALWAVERFDGRSDRLHAAMQGHRATMDETRVLIGGMRGKLERLRALIGFLGGA
jgi:hypothetical protein